MSTNYGTRIATEHRGILIASRMGNADGIEWPNCNTRQKSCRCPDSDSKKPRCACDNCGALKGTVPVVANGGIGDTTGTVPFARKALHSTPFAGDAALKLC